MFYLELELHPQRVFPERCDIFNVEFSSHGNYLKDTCPFCIIQNLLEFPGT
jgi:hypothetical protein